MVAATRRRVVNTNRSPDNYASLNYMVLTLSKGIILQTFLRVLKTGFSFSSSFHTQFILLHLSLYFFTIFILIIFHKKLLHFRSVLIHFFSYRFFYFIFKEISHIFHSFTCFASSFISILTSFSPCSNIPCFTIHAHRNHSGSP